MRPRFLIFVLAVSVFIIADIGTAYAYRELYSSSAITGKGEIPLNVQAILDNFDTGLTRNVWNCLTGTFSKSSATNPPANEKCAASYVVDADAARGSCLKLDYDVSQTSSSDGKPTFAGYYSQMGGGSLTKPDGSVLYTAVSFWVKGADGGEFFKIQIKNKSETQYLYTNPYNSSDWTHYYRNEAAVYITDHLDGGVEKDVWKKVIIPFHNFANLDGWSAMSEFVIVFENSQSTANGSATSGTIYIDDIMFETAVTAPVSAVKIDSFGDKLLINSLGGNMSVSGTVTGGLLSFAPKSDAVHTCLNALKYDFKVPNDGNYMVASFIFGGGNDFKNPPLITGMEIPDKSGWIPVSQDFSAYTNITFWARAESEGVDNPQGFKVELHDFFGTGNGEPFYRILQ
jgi:hypothetical protein